MFNILSKIVSLIKSDKLNKENHGFLLKIKSDINTHCDIKCNIGNMEYQNQYCDLFKLKEKVKELIER